MNSQEAKKHIEVNQDYKFVAVLVPPLLYIANKKSGKTHTEIGYPQGLIEGSGSLRNPFRPKQPDNFKAGTMRVSGDGQVAMTGYSTDFTQYSFTQAQLEAFFESADIQIVG